ncbi:LOW QUALITY PROTEIN: protein DETOXIFICATION 55-like [Asparagus officinalis]|uniref:LOW QUALITY PROTEIN: protein DETOXIFICATION 55-like n=1 Tax=Asparagus officinalis TaxID=4686 RepID=UPI00098E568C|nr:LOW QUALITY PROTEIN: protein DETOXIFICATION 55-like [Asparagus officinalis]
MTEILEELKKMKDVALPIAAINIISYMKSMVSVAFLGRLGPLELAGGALAIGFTNITGYSVLSGLALGMEPISSQAYGSHNFALLSSTLRRAVLMLLLVSAPIAVLWLHLLPILLLLQQDPSVASVAAQYCLFSLPDLIANSLLQPIRIHLRSQGNPQPLMYSSLLSSLLHLPLTYFLTKTLGVPGVSVAAFATNFNTLLFILAYMVITKTSADHKSEHLYDALPSKDTSSLKSGWGPLIKLALPSCLAVCLEWWWYELMTLASGYLSNPRVSLAASAIVIQTTSLMYTLPTTLSTTVSSRVGNELGAGRLTQARAAAAGAMGLAAAGSCIALRGATLGREAWGRVFTDDTEVLKLTKTVLPIIGLCELANCPQTTGCGVLRGSARPSTGAAINFYSFYVVGAPVALLLAFVFNLGFVGLCIGLLTAQITCAALIGVVTWRTNWHKEAMKATDLVGRGEEENEEVVKMVKEEGSITVAGRGGSGQFLEEASGAGDVEGGGR